LNGPDHGSDLVGGNDGAVELVGLVLKFLIGFLPAHLAGGALLGAHVHAQLRSCRPSHHLGLDPVHVEADVDMVSDGLFVVYSMTRFLWKNPNACLLGVAVRPMMKASK